VYEFMSLVGHRIAEPERSASISKESLAALCAGQEQDEVRWQLFEQACKLDSEFIVSLESVPWPRGPEGNILWLHADAPIEQLRRSVQVALLRFHPDKFIARWGSQVTAADRKTGSLLMQKLADTTREICELKDEFCVESSGGVREHVNSSPPECIICLEMGTTDCILLRTNCCRQRICTDCFTLDSERKEVPTCPYCRHANYQASQPAITKRRGRASSNSAQRDRSRSPRRALAALSDDAIAIAPDD